ncbi:MAG: hypothetical protein Q9227_009039 [Pyrenula ochraceoflavens]
MIAPPGTQWLGLGQGSEMAAANIFIMYSASSSNITVSPRLGKGNFEPLFNPSAQITVLEGSGISESGLMTANVRCDSCLNWGAGSVSIDNTKSAWIWSAHYGDPVNSANTTEILPQHNEMGRFTLDLQAATGGNGPNPFQGLSNATASNETSSSSSSTSSSLSNDSVSTTHRRAHAILMSLSFAFLLPLTALTLYPPTTRKILYIHAPLQLLTLTLVIAGMGLGISMARSLHELSNYHPIIGLVTVSLLVLFQPALGFWQHLHFRRHAAPSRSIGFTHRWLGRTLIVLGVVNGGLGFKLAGPVGSDNVPRWAVIVYGVVAGVVAVIYFGVVVFNMGRQGAKERLKGEGMMRRAEEKRYSQMVGEGGYGYGGAGGMGQGAYAMNRLGREGERMG